MRGRTLRRKCNDCFPYGAPVIKQTGDFDRRQQDGLGSVQRASPGGNPLAIICEVLAVAARENAIEIENGSSVFAIMPGGR